MVKVLYLLFLIVVDSSAWGATLDVDDDPLDAEDDDTLDFTQQELKEISKAYLGIGLGNINPWQFWGMSLVWPKEHGFLWVANIGGGGFELTDTALGKTYYMDTRSRSVGFGFRHYFSDFASFYYEPVAQLNTWSGSIKPKGSDSITDTLSSSITSDYSNLGTTIGIKAGFSWFWSNWSLDVGILQFSASALLSESYTNNTKAARDNIREQIRGPHTWAGMNFTVNYTINPGKNN